MRCGGVGSVPDKKGSGICSQFSVLVTGFSLKISGLRIIVTRIVTRNRVPPRIWHSRNSFFSMYHSDIKPRLFRPP